MGSSPHHRKTVLIVQARMTSTRLPGKVLQPVLGRPLLSYQIERLRRVRRADEIVIATTTNGEDEPIVKLCRQEGVEVSRGSEQDVLGRYHAAAIAHGAEVVVRITSDCPLIDPAIVDLAIERFLDSECDYLSNEKGFPRGLDVEVLSFAALAAAHRNAKSLSEREHVTPYIYGVPGRFRLGVVSNSSDESRHRWTVDTAEDFELVRRMITELYPKKPEFNLDDCLELLRQHPDWAELNAHIRQKGIRDN